MELVVDYRVKILLYLNENLRIAKISTEGTFYFHKDHLGSSTVMTDFYGVGTAEATDYMPFGSMRDHTGIDVSAYKFTDQELDAETGLYNYGARLYDPVIGRFICADIIIPDLYNPQSLNRYSYCLNNPLIYVDPNGQNYGGYGDADTADSAETGPGGSSDASGGGYTDVNDNTNNSMNGLSDPSSSDDGNETSNSETNDQVDPEDKEKEKNITISKIKAAGKVVTAGAITIAGIVTLPEGAPAVVGGVIYGSKSLLEASIVFGFKEDLQGIPSDYSIAASVVQGIVDDMLCGHPETNMDIKGSVLRGIADAYGIN